MKKLFNICMFTAIFSFFLQGSAANALLGLFFAGAIPGTNLSIPFWMMMAGYCTLISLIVARCLESVYSTYSTKRLSSTQQKMPRRRYSQITS